MSRPGLQSPHEISRLNRTVDRGARSGGEGEIGFETPPRELKTYNVNMNINNALIA